jgi:16S rRNA (uracil1498-N3)-methyltransferase
VNLLLFEDRELDADGRLEIGDRRFRHLHDILAVRCGDRVRVGAINGLRGEARVEQIDARTAVLHPELREEPPEALPLTVVLALPRPKMLRRILRALAEVGVKELHLINSYRVEKSYWQSPLLAPTALREYLLAGLEQAGDTRLPQVALHRRFRPFAEDLLPALSRGRDALLAAPAAAHPYPPRPGAPALLVIGPEGGFIPFESALLTAAGCRPVTLGARVLRVETALHCALGRHLGVSAA